MQSRDSPFETDGNTGINHDLVHDLSAHRISEMSLLPRYGDSLKLSLGQAVVQSSSHMTCQFLLFAQNSQECQTDKRTLFPVQSGPGPDIVPRKFRCVLLTQSRKVRGSIAQRSIDILLTRQNECAGILVNRNLRHRP